MIFKKIHQSFWASLKHPLLSLEDHWYLYQTLKCTRSFSTNFHNGWNLVTSIIRHFGIIFLMFTMITNIFSILWLSVELIFALIIFLSLLEICASSHMSHDMCEKWIFSRFYSENVKKILISYNFQNSIFMLILSVELN